MDRYKFDIGFARFLQIFIAPFVKSRFNFKREGRYKAPDEPFVLICNHVTNLDMIWVGDSFDKHMYYVASEHVVRGGLGGKVVNLLFKPIVREKATVGLSTVVEMKNHLKAGHNVCIFAEGLRSANGTSNKIVESTGAVLKKLGATVVTFKLHGGFLTSPRWASDIRKGGMTGELVKVYSSEEISKMTPTQINDALNSDIYEDAYEYNESRKIAYKSKKAAEGIEYELVVCPKCRKFATIHSRKSEFFCECGLKGKYDEYGLLSGEGFDFTRLNEWDSWQKEYISNLPDIDGEQVLVSHSDQILKQIVKGHDDVIVDTGEIVLTNKSISVGNTTIPFENIRGSDIFFHGNILLYTKDKKYYEIRNDKSKIPGYLYVLLMNRYGEV